MKQFGLFLKTSMEITNIMPEKYLEALSVVGGINACSLCRNKIHP